MPNERRAPRAISVRRRRAGSAIRPIRTASACGIRPRARRQRDQHVRFGHAGGSGDLERRIQVVCGSGSHGQLLSCGAKVLPIGFGRFARETSQIAGRTRLRVAVLQPGQLSPARLDSFDKHQPFALGQRAHRLEAVGFERLGRVARRDERRTALRPRQERAEARRAAPRRRPARGRPGAGRARARESPRRDLRRASCRAGRPVSSTTARSNASSSSGRRGRRRDFDLDQHAGVLGAPCARAPPTLRPARRRRRGPTGRPCAATAASRPPCAQPTCTNAIAHFHAGHADDQEVRIARFRNIVSSAFSYRRTAA